jgi:hypothetical protein
VVQHRTWAGVVPDASAPVAVGVDDERIREILGICEAARMRKAFYAGEDMATGRYCRSPLRQPRRRATRRRKG